MQKAKAISDIQELRIDLLSDFLLFQRVMFEKRTGREFILSNPHNNESHFKTITRELEHVFYGGTTRLNINLAPGWSKSEMCKGFVCWCMAHYPDCKFLYVSHSFELATMHTASIKQTMMLPLYRHLFDIEIRRDSSAKDFFQTTAGGAVAAFGSQGGITGHDAGLPGLDRFSGGLIIDDIHKPEDIHSDTIRERVKRNYFETIERRLRSPSVPVIMLGQRLHEDDLTAHLASGADGQEWKNVIIKALDDFGNPRYPEVNPRQQLMIMKEKQPYVFASQYQQDPVPAGGALFKEEWFVTLESEPEILSTFITIDSAETEKLYNDATAMSFWGIYKLKHEGTDLGLYALHWMDCIEEWVEPKDLESLFMDFYTACLRHPVKPSVVAIEKKSTGTTLLSLLKQRQGLTMVDVNRSIADYSKTDRFIQIQEFITNRQVTLPLYGRHNTKVIKHMSKITANNTHARDDIADTCQMAIDIGLVRKMIVRQTASGRENDDKVKRVMKSFTDSQRIRKNKY